MAADRRPNKDRRTELILIAYDHIAKRGFEGLRVREVASEAGINNATLHYYFPTKEDLIKGVVDHMIQEFSLSVFPTVTSMDHPDAWQEMRGEFEDARHRLQATPEEFIVYVELLVRSLREPSIKKIFKKFDEGWRNSLVGIIENGMKQGIFRAELDPPLVTTLILLQIKGLMLQMLIDPKRRIEDAVFNQLTLQVKSWLTSKDGTH